MSKIEADHSFTPFICNSKLTSQTTSEQSCCFSHNQACKHQGDSYIRVLPNDYVHQAWMWPLILKHRREKSVSTKPKLYYCLWSKDIPLTQSFISSPALYSSKIMFLIGGSTPDGMPHRLNLLKRWSSSKPGWRSWITVLSRKSVCGWKLTRAVLNGKTLAHYTENCSVQCNLKIM